MHIYTPENHGCAYSIDSEGTIYYTPLYQNGTMNFEDWSEVDLMHLMGEEENLRLEIDQIREKLITMMKSVGEYYQK